MQDQISSDQAIKVLEGISNAVEKNLDFLTTLDQAIGDGDHGISLNKGFKRVNDELSELEGEDIGTILKRVGSILLSNVGGAAGPLYGMAFIRAGEVALGRNEADIDLLCKMFEAAEKGIIDIGKASVGEKTMLDAIHPAVVAIVKAVKEKKTLVEGLRSSVKAALEGVEKTKEMVSKRGRSSYLGERSKGHQDVGATSSYIILKAALDTLELIRQANSK